MFIKNAMRSQAIFSPYYLIQKPKLVHSEKAAVEE